MAWVSHREARCWDRDVETQPSSPRIPRRERGPEHIWGPCSPEQEWCWPTSLGRKHLVGLHTMGPGEMGMGVAASRWNLVTWKPCEAAGISGGEVGPPRARLNNICLLPILTFTCRRKQAVGNDHLVLKIRTRFFRTKT